MAESSEKSDISQQSLKDEDNSEDFNIVGQRLRQLDKSLTMTIRKIVFSAKLSLLKEHFRPLHDKNPEILKKIHAQFTSQLETNMNAEVSLMFKEEQIKTLLNGLDKIIHDQSNKKGGVSWRPSGDVDKDSFTCRMNVKMKQKSQLEHLVSQLESQNKLFKIHVTAKQKKLLDTKQEIDKQVDKWNEIAEASGSVAEEQIQLFVEKYYGKM